MYSLYFHIPFCIHRCAYCDFNTYAGQEDLIPAYVEALCREVRQVAASAPQRLPVHTIFLGGGTPSLLTAVQFETLLRTVHGAFDMSAEAEISLEANPGTLSREALMDLRRLGFNRLSLGVQSAHPQELHMLERIHDYFDVIDAVRAARQSGFGNLNLDLIYGLPEQTLERWQSSLDLVLGLHPEHLSLYALTVEHGTPFGRWAHAGLLPRPDPDLAADMYEWAETRLAQAGYGQYEISNWAKPGYQCRHNLQYWRGRPYLGFGAGAHGFAAGERYSNALRIRTYIEHIREGQGLPFPLSPAAVDFHAISPFVEMQETMMTGLRLTQEGIGVEEFHDRFGQDLMDVFGREINDLVRLGLLEWTKAGESLRLTDRGRMVGNQVFMRFVG
ncbi:MAG TPA: radical SAM family heme chaperone HemW [Anaerolineales bacterium]